VHIGTRAAADWDRRIVDSALSTGFAEAMATLGQHPFFVDDDRDIALLLVRRLPVPGLRSLTSRIKVYVNHGRQAFLWRLLDQLAARGAGYVLLGDPGRPLPNHLAGDGAGFDVTTHHRVVHDVRRDDDALIAGMHLKARWQIRRAVRDGVAVSEITGEDDLADYCRLAAATAARIRQRNLVAALPDAFFRTILRTMVPRGQARFLIARIDGRPLAGALFLMSPDRMTYYHGVSTRDPALTPIQGPSAIVWHAMRQARDDGRRWFDHGAVTVTADPEHPHHSVYLFKRRFGGHVETAATGTLVLSRTKLAFQEHVMMPAWRRYYPLYLRLMGARPAPAV
jgi:hypothetical protein